MILPDVNILVAAYHDDASEHEQRTQACNLLLPRLMNGEGKLKV